MSVVDEEGWGGPPLLLPRPPLRAALPPRFFLPTGDMDEVLRTRERNQLLCNLLMVG